jgi:DNA-binding NtrC family response regulator
MSFAGKVLVVDDHVDLAENIAEVLSGGGYEVITASSAEEALVKLDQGQVAALVTDYRLPGRNGAELIQELRRRGNDIPALVMSAFTDDDTIAASQAAGAAEVLAKPVPLDRLLSLMDTLGSDRTLVLVVDDNHELAENLAEALRGEGHRVEVTNSMAQALAARPRLEAAIVDFVLPDGTGLDLVRRLTARDPGLPVLFISGHTQALRDGLTGGLATAACLDKPIEVGRLLAWVAAAVRDARTTRPRR